jgi:Stress responsive A/B Barrel Domain
VITHVVLMRLSDDADAAEARSRLEGLAADVPSIRSMEVVLDTLGSPTGHHLALRTTHDDAAGLRDYQQHPAHVAVIEWLRPRLADRAVVDWDS